jgi:DNA-binding transcriptional LysR family regulator
MPLQISTDTSNVDPRLPQDDHRRTEPMKAGTGQRGRHNRNPATVTATHRQHSKRPSRNLLPVVDDIRHRTEGAERSDHHPPSTHPDRSRRGSGRSTEAEAIEEIAIRQKSEPQGLVRVSCPVGADRILSAALSRFLKQYHRVRLQLIVTNRRIDLIEEGIDVAIRVRESFDTDADLQLKIIGRTRARLVASPAYLDEEGRPETPADLARFPMLSHSERRGQETWTLQDKAGSEVTIRQEPRLAANDHTILRQAAIEGIGIAFLPELVCREAIADGSLEWLLPEWSGREGVLHLIFTTRRGLLPGVRAFIDFAAEALDPLSPDWQSIL